MNALAVISVEDLRALIREELEAATPAPVEPPRVLDRKGLASALGCCVDVIDKLRREGMPMIYVAESPRFELAAVLDWLRTRAPTTRVVAKKRAP